MVYREAFWIGEHQLGNSWMTLWRPLAKVPSWHPLDWKGRLGRGFGWFHAEHIGLMLVRNRPKPAIAD